MSQDRDRSPGYKLTDYSPNETAARVVEIGLWPTRDFLHSPVGCHQWFDWSEIFAEGATETLLSISKSFPSSSIRIACLQTDAPIQKSSSIRVVEINNEDIPDSYFKAIWDERSTSLSVAIPVAARIVLMWDDGENWIIVNDRFYEIGLFATLGSKAGTLNVCFFHGLSEQELLERFSRILRTNKVAGFAEIRRWSDGT